jgi:hypothetical protein
MRPKHKPGMICIFLRNLNEANPRAEDAEFVARMSAYDTAFKMQIKAPEVFDLSKEPQETLDLYGVGNPLMDEYGRRCLMARRMVEKSELYAAPAVPPVQQCRGCQYP